VPADLRPLTEEEISEFIEWQFEQYVEERVRSGERPDIARRIASEQSRALFPEGVPADGQLLFRVLDDERTAVGMLWIGPQQPADHPGAFWVFYVRIEEAHRGKGYGRAAMELAESEARSRGASELGLNVFGHNQVARHLYESMGYAATSIRMKKDL
jgi:ribosomal protein S18 acetylase RimI-like enzyme